MPSLLKRLKQTTAGSDARPLPGTGAGTPHDPCELPGKPLGGGSVEHGAIGVCSAVTFSTTTTPSAAVASSCASLGHCHSHTLVAVCTSHLAIQDPAGSVAHCGQAVLASHECGGQAIFVLPQGAGHHLHQMHHHHRPSAAGNSALDTSVEHARFCEGCADPAHVEWHSRGGAAEVFGTAPIKTVAAAEAPGSSPCEAADALPHGSRPSILKRTLRRMSKHARGSVKQLATAKTGSKLDFSDTLREGSDDVPGTSRCANPSDRQSQTVAKVATPFPPAPLGFFARLTRRKASITSLSSLSSSGSSLSLASQASSVSTSTLSASSKLGKLFESYSDPDNPTLITDAGAELLCSDLGLSPTDFRVIWLAWKLRATTLSRITRSQFVDGLSALGVETIATLQTLLPTLVDETADVHSSAFRSLYMFTFNFGVDSERGARTLDINVALALWWLVFTGKRESMAVFPRWIAYLMGFDLHSSSDAMAALERRVTGSSDESSDSSSMLAGDTSGCVSETDTVTEDNPDAAASSFKHPDPAPVRTPPVRGISKDCWAQFLDFALSTTDSDCTGFDESEAWPTLIDAFVAAIRSCRVE
ncbi:Dcun1d3 protein [Capsaspora owczarzaki ATCC 30864]|uniref:Defective in cullin neddylation protein n=1 Tax=Capsaspora owczarzaki (strain ATCC 30864) TaxID=595528 RepID=A0A0D2X3T1_CAPO3|nr:Dcun1d3 protein [Capsaspora owczarzaki ATCC 30864]KJE94849.1 Dcun1d3 protein [Capsaspora owczarzaki ATCC 30864]|eukprot:XP_004346093.2 Dcun1d3 protein [Capsaspora owczarzaki ATCC 30864]